MRGEVKKNIDFGNVKGVANELIIYFDEDLFNDAVYCKDGDKRDGLIEEAKRIIDAHLSELKGTTVDGIKYMSYLTFNLEGLPEVKFVRELNEGEKKFPVNTSVLSLFQEIAAYATEQVLGIVLEKKGRKWFRKPGAPIPRVMAEKSEKSVKEAIEHDGCWGCMGISVHTGVDSIDNPLSCPL